MVRGAGHWMPWSMSTLCVDPSSTVQWTQDAAPDADFTQYVQQTGQDVITLVTCTGQFSGGHYSDRFIVRGTRV